MLHHAHLASSPSRQNANCSRLAALKYYMLIVDRIDHTVDLVTVAAHHGQAQAKASNLLLLGHVEHQLVDHGLRLVDLSDIGQRRRVSNAQLKGYPRARSDAQARARVLLALNLATRPSAKPEPKYSPKENRSIR